MASKGNDSTDSDEKELSDNLDDKSYRIVPLRNDIDVRSLMSDGAEIEVDNQAYFAHVEEMEHMPYIQKGQESTVRNEFDDMSFLSLADDMEELTPDRGILKQTIRPGAGPTIAEGMMVKFHFASYLEMSSEPYDSTQQRRKPFTCRLDAGNLFQGLEVAIHTMKKHEEAEFIFSPKYAYGTQGCPPRVPPNAYVYSVVTVLECFQPRPPAEGDETPFERAKSAAKFHIKKGNEQFRANLIHRAIYQFRKGADRLESVNLKDEKEESEWKSLLNSLYLNLSRSYLANARYPSTITYCNNVLRLAEQTDNHSRSRAFLRRGRAETMLGNYDLARASLRQALEITTDKKKVTEFIEDLAKKEKRSKQDEKQLYMRMFGFGGKSTPSESDSATLAATSSTTATTLCDTESVATTSSMASLMAAMNELPDGGVALNGESRESSETSKSTSESSKPQSDGNTSKPQEDGESSKLVEPPKPEDLSQVPKSKESQAIPDLLAHRGLSELD